MEPMVSSGDAPLVETPTPKRATRKGKRAPGMTVLSVPIHRSLRRRIGKLAADAEKTPARWAREKLTSLVQRSEAVRRLPARKP